MWKLLNSVFGGKIKDAEDPVSPEEASEKSVCITKTEGPEVKKDKLIHETDEGDSQKCQQKEGIITLLDEALAVGIIDNKYRFQKCDVAFPLKRSMTVDFEAFYDDESSTWLAKNLRPAISKKEKDIQLRARQKTVNYKILEFRDDCVKLGPGEPSRNSNDAEDRSFSLSKTDLPNDFKAAIGDWLSVSLMEKEGSTREGDTAYVVGVNWVDMRTSVGKVIKRFDQWCVDDDTGGLVRFTQDAIETDRFPTIGDIVRVVAVASDRDHKDITSRNKVYTYKRRALEVRYEKPISRKPVDSLDRVDENEVNALEEKFKTLLQNKNYVRISPSPAIFFKELKYQGGVAIRTIDVNNFGNTAGVLLTGITLGNVQDVCSYKFEREDETPMPESFHPILIDPGDQLKLRLKCHPLQLGRTKDICIFHFAGFKIGRIILARVYSEDERTILVKSKELSAMKRQYIVKEKPGVDSLFNEIKVEIVAPAKVRAPFFIPHRCKEYPIPKPLMQCFESEDTDALINFCPSMVRLDGSKFVERELDALNYVERFQVCIWFEEIQCRLLRREYDMVDVILREDRNSHFIFEAPRAREFSPQLLVGDIIKVTTLDGEIPATGGRITKIFLSDDDIPKIQVKFHERFDRLYNSKPVPLRVEFVLGRNTYKRMHFAVEHAMQHLGPSWLFPGKNLELQEPRIHFIEDINDNLHPKQIQPCFVPVGGKVEQENGEEERRARSLFKYKGRVQMPSYGVVTLKWHNHDLNEEQRSAVRRILRGQGRPLPYIIFGPPGTGKTVTVVEAIMQIYFLEPTSRILVTVPSNAGADLIAEKLVATNLFAPGDFVRLNGFIRAENNPLNTIADFCEDGEYLDAIAKHRLIISTVCTAGQFFQLHLNTGHFSHVFVDEAGYCTEPETMIPCVLAAIDKQSQVILAGDPEQLGPVLMCDVHATEKLLERSFLERLMSTRTYSRDEVNFPGTKYNPAFLTKLLKSYRSHPMLLKVPSELFYDAELASFAKKEEVYDLCASLNDIPKKGVPLIFHGVKGNCRKDDDSPSWYNMAEVTQITKYVKILRNNGVFSEDIGIITPYRKQVEKLKIALQLTLLEDELPKIASVQEFQGGERKVMIISTVRSELDDLMSGSSIAKLDFLYSKKRFNVAVTRAKAFMIVIGNPYVLYKNKYWKKLLVYAIDLGVYTGSDLPNELDPRLKDLVQKFTWSTNDIPNLARSDTSSDDEESDEEM